MKGSEFKTICPNIGAVLRTILLVRGDKISSPYAQYIKIFTGLRMCNYSNIPMYSYSSKKKLSFPRQLIAQKKKIYKPEKQIRKNM